MLIYVLEGVLDLGLGAMVPGSHADDRHLDAVAELQGLGHDGGEVGDGQLERKEEREGGLVGLRAGEELN